MRIQLNKPFAYICGFATIILLISVISNLILYGLETIFHFQMNANNKIVYYPLWAKLLLASLAVPIVETYLFQQLPYTFLKKWKASNTIIIIISSFLFALSHSYNIPYMIYAFLAGIALMIGFINWEGSLKSKYLITAAIHGLVNTCVTILYFFFS